MNILKIFKKEFENFTLFEIIFFFFILFLTVGISLYLKDSKVALMSALCGISYTILAGKGRISCYFIGMIGTFCYCYITYKNGFYGNLALYAFYYFPMEIIGIFKWLKNLKKDKQEIIKTKLTNIQRILYFSLTFLGVILGIVILNLLNGKVVFIDSIVTVFSILGQFLTVKRCIEQWYVWIIVNFLSLIMWVIAYMNGSNCFATIIMWCVYLFLAFYFLNIWKKEVK